MTRAHVGIVSAFLFGAGAVLVLLGLLTAIFSLAHIPAAGLLFAFLLLTGLFAIVGACFGLIAGLTATATDQMQTFGRVAAIAAAAILTACSVIAISTVSVRFSPSSSSPMGWGWYIERAPRDRQSESVQRSETRS